MQAGVTNGGHRNRSGHYAVDGLGLDENWSVSAPGEANRNEDYRGWGRTLIVPADGVVVRAVWERPDQPVAGVSDPHYYADGFPDGGDPGNHLVIDHGDGEFSMIAHFQAGSMLVRPGAKVRRGEPIGKLGNSGDTTGPTCTISSRPGRSGRRATHSRISSVTSAPSRSCAGRSSSRSKPLPAAP